MEYSAGMVSRPYWYIESKKTAKHLIEGFDKNHIKNLVISENIYQVTGEVRAIQIFNTVYKRLSSLDNVLLNGLANSDVTTSKIITLFSIMKTDRLFFEFMYEVFREKLILGDFILKERDINLFFENKKTQSDVIAKWTEKTVSKLKNTYFRILFEVGLIEDISKDRKITPINLDYKLTEHLEQNNMKVFLNCINGNS